MLVWLVSGFAGTAAIAAPLCPGTDATADATTLVRAAATFLGATPRNRTGAAACLEAAFAAGDPGAAVVRGQLALDGADGAPDPTLAASWFFKAARAGSPQGYLAVGEALAVGNGVPADPNWAYWYLGRALRLPGLTPQETRHARELAASVSPRLTTAERANLDANLGGGSAP